ncbi:MAG TPA: pseudouridine synthase [Pirellulales bacterium]|jgi:23S rRNA pseudouridine2605 synthase|nr:pseudouridine synthase [Pirellulales bacterium]
MKKQRFPSGLPPKAAPPRADVGRGARERLQKVLAAAGLGSRRKCEELISEGRVEIDGAVVTELGTKVDPDRQKVLVDGEPLRHSELEYYAVYKPNGVVTTNYDPAGRPRVVDLVPDGERLFPIGRLDMYSEGLILVTNDGDLTNRLAHPRYGVEKTYQALVVGAADHETLEKLRRGVHLAEGFAHAKQVLIRAKSPQSTLLEIVLDEGRNREIRRLLAKLGHKVLKLKRISIGPLKIGEMLPGEYRPLNAAEVEQLQKLVAGAPAPRSKKVPRPRRPSIARGDRTAAGYEKRLAPRGGKKPAAKPTFRSGRGQERALAEPAGRRAEARKAKPAIGPKVKRRPKPVPRAARELPEE